MARLAIDVRSRTSEKTIADDKTLTLTVRHGNKKMAMLDVWVESDGMVRVLYQGKEMIYSDDTEDTYRGTYTVNDNGNA